MRLGGLSAVSSLWRATIRCAVVAADSLPAAELAPGDSYPFRYSPALNPHMEGCDWCSVHGTPYQHCPSGGAISLHFNPKPYAGLSLKPFPSLRRDGGHSALRTPINARAALLAGTDFAAATRRPLQPAG